MTIYGDNNPRRLLSVAATLPTARARTVVAALLARDEAPEPTELEQAAAAFAHDLQPVCVALVEALQAGDMQALSKLRSRLPELLIEAARDSLLEHVLANQIGRHFVAAFDETHGAPIKSAEAAADLTDSLLQWRSRELFTTAQSSAGLRSVPRDVRLRAVFSARTTHAGYISDVAQTVDDMLAGKINLATGRLHLMRRLAELGYDPQTGFPGEMAAIPPAERGSIRDLSSQTRIDLMLTTNQRMAANYGRMIAGNTEYARRYYPAWELVRIFPRVIERGSEKSHTAGWQKRWVAAGDEVKWEGAIAQPMIALKDSPLWQSLGDGAGDYTDVLDNPFPPYAFGSGMGWRAVPLAEMKALGFDERVPAPMPGSLSPGAKEVNEVFARMPADLQVALKKELGL